MSASAKRKLEPAFQIALELPQPRRQDKERSFFRRNFSVSCANVLPVHKLPRVVQEPNLQRVIFMRIYMKLMQGEVDTLHGIQKCFHPDKALYDLRDVMERSLTDSIESDVIVVSGADFVGYRAHRSVLVGKKEKILLIGFKIN